MTIVLDTSALLYWTLDPEKLTAKGHQFISGASRILICSISIWEIGIKVNKGKLQIPLSIAEYSKQLQRVRHVEIMPVDVETWLENLALDWEHRDPADRTIVATARLHDVPLLTSDSTILNFYPKAVW